MKEDHVNGKSTFSTFAEDHKKLLNTIIRNDLSLLRNSFSLMLETPMLIEFDNKRAHFRSMLRVGREFARTLRINVHRDRVFKQSYTQFSYLLSSDLTGDLKVTFEGEQGIDDGGLTREWFQLISKAITAKTPTAEEATKDSLELSRAAEDFSELFIAAVGAVTFQPNPESLAEPSHYKFIGCVVGMALLNTQVVDLHFTPSFYKHILGLGETITYHDMEGLDATLYNNWKWILEDDSEVESLELTFSVEDNNDKIYDLKPSGREIIVTGENKHEYIDLMATYKMTTVIEDQLEAFLEGFKEVIPRELVSMFSHEELSKLVSGMPDIDVNVLVNHAVYEGGYTKKSSVVQWLWEVVSSFDKEDKARFLGFVTGTPRVPSEGFVTITIHRVAASGKTEPLPSAHTCSYQLNLPEYSSKEKLKDKLVFVIRLCAPFYFL